MVIFYSYVNYIRLYPIFSMGDLQDPKKKPTIHMAKKMVRLRTSI